MQTSQQKNKTLEKPTLQPTALNSYKCESKKVFCRKCKEKGST